MRIEKMVRLTYQTACHSKWRRRQTDYTNIGIYDTALVQERSVHALTVGRDHVGLIDDDKIERVESACLFINGLNTGDGDMVIHVLAIETGGVNADVELWRNGRQRIVRLLE